MLLIVLCCILHKTFIQVVEQDEREDYETYDRIHSNADFHGFISPFQIITNIILYLTEHSNDFRHILDIFLFTIKALATNSRELRHSYSKSPGNSFITELFQTISPCLFT